MEKKALYALWDPPQGVPKTAANYPYAKGRPNAGDLPFIYAGALFTVGDHFDAWDFLPLSPEEANERYSRLVMFLPCRIIDPELDYGWYFDRVSDFLQKLKIPVISASESIFIKEYDYPTDLHRRLSPQVVRYLRTVSEKCVQIGTRGAYSAEVLTRLGIRNVEPIGCPSLYINGPELPPSLLQKKPFEELKELALGYTNYQLNPNSLIGDMLALAAEKDYFFVEQQFTLLPKLLYWPGFITHVDLIQAHEIYQGYEMIKALFRKRKIRYFTSYKLWLDFMRGMDFYFGSRLHGGIMSINAEVPAYFVVQDARVREICELYHLPFTPEDEVRRKGIDVQGFYEASDYTEACRTYPRLYQNFLDYLRKNGLEPKVDSKGRLLDFRIAEPDPAVLEELNAEHTLYSDSKSELLDVMFRLGNKFRTEGLSIEAARALGSCNQLMYDAHKLFRERG